MRPTLLLVMYWAHNPDATSLRQFPARHCGIRLDGQINDEIRSSFGDIAIQTLHYMQRYPRRLGDSSHSDTNVSFDSEPYPYAQLRLQKSWCLIESSGRRGYFADVFEHAWRLNVLLWKVVHKATRSVNWGGPDVTGTQFQCRQT